MADDLFNEDGQFSRRALDRLSDEGHAAWQHSGLTGHVSCYLGIGVVAGETPLTPSDAADLIPGLTVTVEEGDDGSLTTVLTLDDDRTLSVVGPTTFTASSITALLVPDDGTLTLGPDAVFQLALGAGGVAPFAFQIVNAPGALAFNLLADAAFNFLASLAATIATGETLSIAGPGTFSVSAPMSLSSNVAVTEDVTLSVEAGDTLAFTGAVDFSGATVTGISTTPGANYAGWALITVNYNESWLNVGINNATATLLTLTAKQVIEAVYARVRTGWTAPGLASCVASLTFVGGGGFFTGFPMGMTASGTIARDTSLTLSYAGGDTVDLNVAADVALDTLTAGVLDIWYKLATLP